MLNLRWQDQAACRALPTEWWFDEDDETVERAKQICQNCPVIQECLDWGLSFEIYGLWGGKTAVERKNIRRKRGIFVSNPQAWAGTGIPHSCGTEAGYQYLLRHADPDAPKGKKVTCQDCLAAHRRKTADNYVARAGKIGGKQVIATEMKRMGLVRRRNIGWLDQDGRLLSPDELKAIRKQIRMNQCP